jgi:hypothetical protein
MVVSPALALSAACWIVSQGAALEPFAASFPEGAGATYRVRPVTETLKPRLIIRMTAISLRIASSFPFLRYNFTAI